MKRNEHRLATSIAMALVVCVVGTAPRAADAAFGDARPTVEIPRLQQAPTLQDFLGMQPAPELAGRLAKIEGFIQQSPEDGKPASQRTNVYLGYDEQNLYCIFVAFDSEPEKMRAHISRREDVFGDETVEIQLDTFNDQRRAFSFLTNPFGNQWDAIWTEGQGFDPSWDTVWQSRGQITEEGFVVWMAIPFKSLRFPRTPDQKWGLVFVRDIPRNNEVSFWPRVSNRIEGRLNQEASITGLSGISPGRNIWLIPYATSRSFRVLKRDATGFERDRFDPDAGLDAKLVLKDSLALDLTANPDFAQVESDQPQVTVNERFEVFFPEKRPFFLENTNYFQTPFNLLFTRRIRDPRAGARLTGKLGPHALGALVIDDEAPGQDPGLAPEDPRVGARARFGVLRLNRDISRQSTLGLTYTHHEFEDSRNEVGGVDGRIKLGSNWDMPFQWVHSSTRTSARRLSDPGYSLAFNRSGRKFGTHIHYFDVGREFRTEAGFIPREDVRDLHTRVNYNFRPEGRRLVRWQPSLFVQRISDHAGTRLDWTLNGGVEWEFRRQTSFGISGSRGRERLRPEDFPTLTAARDFRRSEWRVYFDTRFIDAVGLDFGLSGGEGINVVPPEGAAPGPADFVSGNLDLEIRPSQKLRVDTTYLWTRLSAATGGGQILANRIYRSRFNWQLDPRLSLRMILQYETLQANPSRTVLPESRNFNGDLLLTYLVNPWTALYVGYNGNYLRPDPRIAPGLPRGTLRDEFVNDGRQLFVKFSYLFRL